MIDQPYHKPNGVVIVVMYLGVKPRTLVLASLGALANWVSPATYFWDILYVFLERICQKWSNCCHLECVCVWLNILVCVDKNILSNLKIIVLIFFSTKNSYMLVLQHEPLGNSIIRFFLFFHEVFFNSN